MNAMNAMTKKQRKQNTAKRNEELNATNQMVVTPAHYEELEELQLESVAGGNRQWQRHRWNLASAGKGKEGKGKWWNGYKNGRQKKTRCQV